MYWVFTDPNGFGHWIEGQIPFNIKSLNLWAMDDGIGGMHVIEPKLYIWVHPQSFHPPPSPCPVIIGAPGRPYQVSPHHNTVRDGRIWIFPMCLCVCKNDPMIWVRWLFNGPPSWVQARKGIGDERSWWGLDMCKNQLYPIILASSS